MHYLCSAPVSYPLIFATQIGHYCAMLDRAGTSHAKMLGAFKGATGHSQGVVAAAVISSAPTDAALVESAATAAKYMLWQGTRCQQVLNCDVQYTGATPESSPMLAVTGMTVDTLTKLVITENKAAGSDLLSVSIVNNHQECAVSGPPDSLVHLREQIAKMSAETGSQARVPYSLRKPETSTAFLRVSAPFHSPACASAVAPITADAARVGFTLGTLAIPVYSTADGSAITSLEQLIAMQATGCMRFRAAVATLDQAHGVTHILDLGPGGGRTGSGVGGSAQFTADIKEGAGIRVLLARVTTPDVVVESTPHIGGLNDLFSGEMVFGPNWAVAHAPTLVKRASDGKMVLNTRFTEVVGKPPCIMSGMTPTTSTNGLELVAACGNGGSVAPYRPAALRPVWLGWIGTCREWLCTAGSQSTYTPLFPAVVFLQIPRRACRRWAAPARLCSADCKQAR